MRPITSFAALSALLLTTACASPSAQHSTQAANHSAQGSAHGSAAIVTGAANITAVPLVAAGSVLVVSGVALAQVGAPVDCANWDDACVVPDGPPVLR